MHHTDYSENLRAAHRRTIKNRTNRTIPVNTDYTESKDLHYAVVAAVLVLLCLLQMDPANASDCHESYDQSDRNTQLSTPLNSAGL